MDLTRVLASKTVARGTDGRDDVYHGQQSAKENYCGSASALKETEHWRAQDRTFERRRVLRQIRSNRLFLTSRQPGKLRAPHRLNWRQIVHVMNQPGTLSLFYEITSSNSQLDPRSPNGPFVANRCHTLEDVMADV
jgi:hypothetical protein